MFPYQRSLFLICYLAVSLVAFTQTPPIGSWRMHISYAGTIDVVKGDKIYATTNQGVFSTDNALSFEYFNKLTGLSEASISKLGWDSQTQQLVVAYSSSNIDVIKGGLVKNINDILRSGGQKKINGIYCENGLAYLSTSIGVIVADLTKYEIKESWILGANGNTIDVFSLTKDNNFWYAATSNGIYKTTISNTNISDAKTWSFYYRNNTGNPIKKISSATTGLIVEQNDSLLLIQPTSTSTLFYQPQQQIKTWAYNEQKITIGTVHAQTGRAFIHLTTPSTSSNIVFEQPGTIIKPVACSLSNGIIWISDSITGLIKLDPVANSFLKIIPNGPAGQVTTGLLATNSAIVASGATKQGLFVFENGAWQQQKQNGLDSIITIESISQNKIDNSIWMSSAGSGAVQLNGNKMQVFNQRNSSLIGTANNLCYSSGVATDSKGNSWVSNTGTNVSLHVKQLDGKWTGFTNPFGITDAGTIEIDDAGYIWCTTKNANGLLVYNPGNSITSAADDRWKLYKAGTGNGNLPSNQVNCTAVDKNGFIWVGTDRGIGIIQCANQVFDNTGCDALLPVVQQDRFAGLLFKDENVQTIAVDGADRKWVGTKNGVWLISATGEKIIYKFSTSNSPLLGNDISKISIDPNTGEVFIATNNGLCSFRSTATEGTTIQQNVLVFPNPVPPGYNGSIAIRGLTQNALVKITTLYGALVYQTRALGGQAIWDGKNTSGQKVASGVYLIICRDDSGLEKIASKITIVQGR
jgi:streptogramin lyase